MQTTAQNQLPEDNPNQVKDFAMAPDKAAQFAGLSKQYLAKLRCEGGGPKFRKIGKRVVYFQSDVIEWLESHSPQSTTAG